MAKGNLNRMGVPHFAIALEANNNDLICYNTFLYMALQKIIEIKP